MIRPPGLRRAWWASPALRAVLLQCLVLPAVWFLWQALLPLLWQPQMGQMPALLLFSVLQGMIAALLTPVLRLARWWVLIQFLFPLAILLALQFHIAPVWYLTAFIFSVLLYWSTFRTQVPYYPSGKRVWQALLAQLPARPATVADLGSGLGGMLLFLATQRSDLLLHGLEMAPLPWFVSRLRAAVQGNRVRFFRADYQQADLAQYDLVFAYLAPPAMPSLWLQAKAQMRPGSWLFSYEFPVPGQAPDFCQELGTRGRILYGWRI